MNVVTPFFIYTPFIVLPALLYGHSLAESKNQKWVHAPDVKAFKAGGKWAIRARDVAEWEEIQIVNKYF